MRILLFFIFNAFVASSGIAMIHEAKDAIATRASSK